jgi:hypothetical protein
MKNAMSWSGRNLGAHGAEGKLFADVIMPLQK